MQHHLSAPAAPLYTPEQRRRRDRSPWTRVQGVLAPLQFLACLVSLGLVLRYLGSGEGLAAAAASVVLKAAFLYAIMITGSLWEKDVFGRYLFARPFFWEDVVSLGVIALHTAYAAYGVNAAQFVLKLRAARRAPASAGPALAGVAE